MFSANLSFKLLEKYLDLTLDSGLLRADGSIYRLTDAGQEFLDIYRGFNERYLRVQELLVDLSSEQERLNRLISKPSLVRVAPNKAVE